MLLVVVQGGVRPGDGQAIIEQRMALGGGRAQGRERIGRGLDGKLRKNRRFQFTSLMPASAQNEVVKVTRNERDSTGWK